MNPEQDLPATLASALPDFPGPGSRIAGRYLLESPLGRGGMGIVYEAIQLDLGRPVAMKLLPPSSDPVSAARFAREATTLAQLAHPNIVQIFDYGVDAGVAFVAMERLHGRTLAAAIGSEAPFDAGRAVAIACEMLTGLGVAHDAGVVHRDIKPANVFLVASSDRASGERVKLLDFGIATTSDGSPRLTETGAMIGTPAYMAPEQILASASDPRSDLRAVGVCLFEMLAGRRPFVGQKPADVVAQIIRGTAPRLDAVRADVPTRLADVVERALAREPGARFPTAAAMLEALSPWRLGAPTLAAMLAPPLAPAQAWPSATQTTRGSMPMAPPALAMQVAPSQVMVAPAPSPAPVRGGNTHLWAILFASILVTVLAGIGVAVYAFVTLGKPGASAAAPASAGAAPSPAGATSNPALAPKTPGVASGSSGGRGAATPAGAAGAAAAGARVPCICIDANNNALCQSKLTTCECRGKPAILFSRVQTKGSTDPQAREVPGGADGQPCTGFSRDATSTGDFAGSTQESGVLQNCEDCSRQKAIARPVPAVPGTPCTGIPPDKGGATTGVFKAK